MSETLSVIAARGASFEYVPLLGEEILATRVGDQVRVVMKPFCEAIGLSWEPQRKRIMRDELLVEGTSMMEVPSDGGPQMALTLPLDVLPGFLLGAEAKRYAPELRDKVRAFRKQCYAVLFAHFFDRPMPAPVVDLPALTAAALESRRLTITIKRERDPDIRRFLYQLLGRLATGQGIDAPPLDRIGKADRPPASDPDELAEILAAFLDALERLSERGFNWQHGNQPGLLIFDLDELTIAANDRGIELAPRGDIEAALRTLAFVVEPRVLTSAQTGKPVFAWIAKDPHHA